MTADSRHVTKTSATRQRLPMAGRSTSWREEVSFGRIRYAFRTAPISSRTRRDAERRSFTCGP